MLSRCAVRRARPSSDGATRFCMGAAWRSPKDRQLDQVIELLKWCARKAWKPASHSACCPPARRTGSSEAGLDYYNHNLDSSPEYYREVITTRSYEDRLDTLGHVRDAGLNVCCGGIVGMGESARRPRRPAAATGQPAGTSAKRAHQ